MTSLVLFASLALTACGDDSAPAVPDARVGYPDIMAIPIDGVSNTDVVVADIVDERGSACRAGAFRPCECDAGEGGRDYCVNMAYEGVCRCGDAGPPVTDAASDARSDAQDDIAASDAQSDAPASDARSDAPASDAAAD